MNILKKQNLESLIEKFEDSIVLEEDIASQVLLSEFAHEIFRRGETLIPKLALYLPELEDEHLKEAWKVFLAWKKRKIDPDYKISVDDDFSAWIEWLQKYKNAEMIKLEKFVENCERAVEVGDIQSNALVSLVSQGPRAVDALLKHFAKKEPRDDMTGNWKFIIHLMMAGESARGWEMPDFKDGFPVWISSLNKYQEAKT